MKCLNGKVGAGTKGALSAGCYVRSWYEDKVGKPLSTRTPVMGDGFSAQCGLGSV